MMIMMMMMMVMETVLATVVSSWSTFSIVNTRFYSKRPTYSRAEGPHFKRTLSVLCVFCIALRVCVFAIAECPFYLEWIHEMVTLNTL